LRKELEADKAGAAGVEENYQAVLENAEAEEAKFNELNATVTRKTIRGEHLRREVEDLQKRKARLTGEMEKARDELTKLAPIAAERTGSDRSKLDNALADMNAIEKHLSEVEEKRLGAEAEFEKARAAFSDAKASLSALEGEAIALKSLLADEPDQTANPVAGEMKIEPGFEAALGAALGDDLDAPIGADGPFAWRTLSSLNNAPALPVGAKPLSDLVTAPAALDRRLSQVGVVEDGEGLMAALLPGQRLVSKEGTLWRWDGLVKTAKAPTRAAMKLQQKNKLEGLEKKEILVRDLVEQMSSALTEKENTLAACKDEETTLRKAYQDVNTRYSQERENISEAESDGIKSAERSAALKEGLGRMEMDLEETRDRAIALETEIKTLGEDTGLEKNLAVARSQMESIREKLAVARSRFETWRQIRDEKEARLASLVRESAAWGERASAAVAQMEELEGRKEETLAALGELDQSPTRFEERRTALMDVMSKTENVSRAARDNLAKIENAATEKDRDLKGAGATLSEIREDMVRQQSHFESTSERQIELDGIIEENFRCTAGDIIAIAEVNEKQLEKLADAEAAEIKLERLKAERERLGAVNLRADVELEDLTTEVERLTTEKVDLEGAIRGLRASIGSLNREGRQKMLEAFETVNKNFGDLFAKIFNGGHAHLVLTEADDPLEAGLDIMASPPGKKLLHRSLLSGGEQALTAITLIFAVFLTNPAPVCVLDEVDAPLDDANVERFCDLLDEIGERTETKFMIVTHNAITMARMERLYGVTMGEQGISQLVSVDLQKVEEMRAFA
ncbi:MAG: hypothetical protein V3R20_04230, partial [Sphingomonadales bacterium]